VAPSDRRSLATAFLLLLALAIPLPALAGSSSPAPVPLAAGQRGSYSWTVKASRLAGPKPCLSVAITHRHGPFSYDRSRFRDCLFSSASLTRRSQPLLVGGTHLGGVGGSRMTVFGILAPAGARQVRVTVSDGLGDAGLSTRLEPIVLSADRARNLRSAIIALPGRRCVERLATESAGGRVLWQGAPGDGCPGPVPEGPQSSASPEPLVPDPPDLGAE
jgi:hypothetical protein